MNKLMKSEHGMKKRVICLVHYDLPDNPDMRRCSLPGYTKSNYIFHCLKRLGYENHILSASPTTGRQNVNGRTIRLDEQTVLELLPSKGRGSKFRNAVVGFFFAEKRYRRLKELVQDGDILWVYHSTGLIKPLHRLKKTGNFRLILEMEELYGDIRCSPKTARREKKLAKLADAFIFPTAELNAMLNTEGKPYAISHGTYETAPAPLVPRLDDGRIHVVYSGTTNPRKGGINMAIDAAAYLPENYHVHILGTGDAETLQAMNQRIRDVQAKAACTVTYDGVLRDRAYTDFLHGCHIGLSTQNPEGDYNNSSFPSKILAYLASGLRVVSVRIPVVVNSRVGNVLHYYEAQTPEALAAAIRSVDVAAAYDSKSLITDLDHEFLEALGRILEQEA